MNNSVLKYKMKTNKQLKDYQVDRVITTHSKDNKREEKYESCILDCQNP